MLILSLDTTTPAGSAALVEDGRVVVLEVDGAFHMEADHWVADIARERALVLGGAVVLRCTAMELRRSPQSVVRDLRAAGVGATLRSCG